MAQQVHSPFHVFQERTRLSQYMAPKVAYSRRFTKEKSRYLFKNCSAAECHWVKTNRQPFMNVVQLLFLENFVYRPINCAVMKRQGRHLPQCPSRKSNKRGKNTSIGRQEKTKPEIQHSDSPDSTEETIEPTSTPPPRSSALPEGLESRQLHLCWPINM